LFDDAFPCANYLIQMQYLVAEVNKTQYGIITANKNLPDIDTSLLVGLK